jgi:hypothetical protein
VAAGMNSSTAKIADARTLFTASPSPSRAKPAWL